VIIEHVTVLPMTPGGGALTDANVIIRGGRIQSIEPTGGEPPPSDARRVDGRDKWLMPALADCHTHVENDRLLRLLLGDPGLPAGTVDEADILIPYVATGVLQIANLGAMSESVGQRDRVESSRVLGPHIMLAAMIDGEPPLWPPGFTRVAATPENGRQVVRDIKAEGYDQVKTYSNLTLETFTAIVDEARRQGMKVVGHIPRRATGQTESFLQPGFGMVAHAEEYAFQSTDLSDADVDRFVAAAKQSGTWLTSTLTLDERILEQTRNPETLRTRPEVRFVHPAVLQGWYEKNPYVGRNSPERIAFLERLVAFNRKLVKAFAEAGIPVVAGTDSLVPGVVAGFALHDEMEALAEAGMTNEQVLESATRLCMEWIGATADRGTVEVGKRADLLLLDADPRVDVANARAIAAVLAGHRYLSRDELVGMLEDLAARYASRITGADAGSGG
jgi:imidazolonepropionase-like amidohydrolase